MEGEERQSLVWRAGKSTLPCAAWVLPNQPGSALHEALPVPMPAPQLPRVVRKQDICSGHTTQEARLSDSMQEPTLWVYSSSQAQLRRQRMMFLQGFANKESRLGDTQDIALRRPHHAGGVILEG